VQACAKLHLLGGGTGGGSIKTKCAKSLGESSICAGFRIAGVMATRIYNLDSLLAGDEATGSSFRDSLQKLTILFIVIYYISANSLSSWVREEAGLSHHRGQRRGGNCESLVSDIMPACQATRNVAFKSYCFNKHCFSCTPGHCNCNLIQNFCMTHILW